MKGIIIIKEERCRWLREPMPSSHPAMFPLCNKPLLEYLLEFAILCGTDTIRLVFDRPDDDIKRYFDSGSRWGVEISYNAIPQQDQVEDILTKNSGFIADEPLLILEGFFFVRFDKNRNYEDLFVPGNTSTELRCDTGEIRFRRSTETPELLKKAAEMDLNLSSIQNIGDIFTLSMNILANDANRYILPGYNNEEGVYIGRNVTIPKSAKITKPILLGNNVQLGKNCEIGPNAIIGNNVIVDSASQIFNSIILDNTYIGSELTFKDKIIKKNIAISRENGKAVQLVDQHLLSGITSGSERKPLSLLIHWCLSLLLFLLAILPALFLRFFLKTKGTWQQEEVPVLLADGTALTLRHITIKASSPLTRIARGLAIDKVFLLPWVLNGALDLVGNKPIRATPEGKELFNDFANYLPGIFYLSEAEKSDSEDFQEEITERFFSANRSLAGDMKVIIKTIINRW